MVAIIRFVLAWLVGALITTALGVIFQTQNVISRLNEIGGTFGWGDRLSMTAYDLQHLGSLYILFIAGGMLIAFLSGFGVYHLAGVGRPIVFAVAGGVAMAVMLMLMKPAFFGVQVIAGARDTSGFIMQILAGVIGGLVFSYLNRSRDRSYPR